jgi:hypothetical protein
LLHPPQTFLPVPGNREDWGLVNNHTIIKILIKGKKNPLPPLLFPERNQNKSFDILKSSKHIKT